MSEAQSDPRFYELRNDAWSDPHRARKLILYDPSILKAKNSIGETALHHLAVEDALEAVEMLLEQGAEVNTRNSFGATPLMEAASLGYGAMCQLLLAHGADVRLADENGATALSKAAQSRSAAKGETALLQVLLEQVAGEDINGLIDDIELIMISNYSHEAVIMLLHSHGLRPVPEED